MQTTQPRLSFWQIWNVSFGFLGVQFGFALQNANVSRILSDLGADLHSLSLFWLVAPIMGLIVQPIVGSASDRTWNRIGRRRPFILAGAIAAVIGMILLPNAPIFVAFLAPMLMGALMVALMDASFNVCFQPFRSLVSDMVPPSQRNVGYSIQSLLINIGAVIGSILPFVLTNVIGLENTAQMGEVAPSVMWAFYIGATVLLGTVIWTVIRTKEYAPEDYNRYKGLSESDIAQSNKEKAPLSQRLSEFFTLVVNMPTTMKQLAVVQFFSWFALFIMWVYTTPAITQHIWGVDKQWFDPAFIAAAPSIPEAITAAKGAAGDWVGILFAAYSVFAAIFSIFLARLADKFGRKTIYAGALALGGISYVSFLLFQDLTSVNVNLLITEVTVPLGAVKLLIPMVGVGIAWAAILAMPYAMLAGALPANKTGVYMGIFNFTVAAPQIVSGLTAGWILSSVFDNEAKYIIVVAGVAMLIGAIAVFFVKETDTHSLEASKGYNSMFFKPSILAIALAGTITTGCVSTKSGEQNIPLNSNKTIIGTDHPFASEAIYFVVTDRFVDGDPKNNHEDQGGSHPTWQLPLEGPDGKKAYVGYMGGDLKGILTNGDYISDMGFTAVWMTPVVDNPDYAFNGDEPITYGGAFKDGGKTGYHGYWATNYYKPDEHLVSDDLSVKQYTDQMREQFGLKSVFDIVANHGSPSFTMESDLPGYGELYDADGKLVADHQNLSPEELDPENNPLHAFFHNYPDLVKLSNLDDENPMVRDYLINSYLYWITQGADAFRIDTIRHVPHAFWREVSDRVRAEHPNFFMFGESFDYEANNIAQHTLPKNGAVSVLDFPMQKAMVKVFEKPLETDFADLENVLYLTHGPYHNPYELTTFYDNHDMARMNATDNGFINAHNWLFTVRGIPVVYMGSEMGYMRGTAEHVGNRNYVGQERLDGANTHPIKKALTNIANVRKATPALQRGVQVNLELQGHRAAFYRIVQNGDKNQIALVLLNKGEESEHFEISEYMQSGVWTEQLTGEVKKLNDKAALVSNVKPNGVQVWVLNDKVKSEALLARLAFQAARQ